MKRSHLVAIAGASSAVVLAISSYASPYWTLRQMHAALAAHDAPRFASYVDFPALRASVKGQVMAAMDRQLGTPELDDNPFANLGKAMGAALVSPMVDAMVTPEGVRAMLEIGQATPRLADDNAPARPAPDYTVSYRSWNTVAVANAEGDAGSFIFKRTGLWSWQLAGLELAPGLLEDGQ